MHSKTLLLFFIGLLPLSSQAASQALQCRFADASSPDRVQVTLSDSSTGTFRYELANPAPADSQVSLKLKRISGEDPNRAYFEVQSSAVRMVFGILSSFLFKAGEGFEASLLTRIPEMDLEQEQGLTCDSVLN